MRYFIDCEFCERGPQHPIELISIGIAAEDGREFYVWNQDFNQQHASRWIHENVLPHMPPRNPKSLAWMPYARIGECVRNFIGDDPEPEFWGYYCAYDYVILSQLMGGMAMWPDGWPCLMQDLRYWLDYEALHHVNQPDDAAHDALQDARWIRDTFAQYLWIMVTV